MNTTQTAPQPAPANAPDPSPIADATIAAFLNTIGKPRLDSYRLYFKCGTDNEVVGAYLWGQAVAAAFTPLVSTFEIVLRNAIHREASLFASRQANTSHPWYDFTRADAFRMVGKSREKITAQLYDAPASPNPLRKAMQPAPDQVVASLSFGFWPAFLEGLTKREQPRMLTDIFAHHPHSKPKHWGVQGNVDAVIGALKSVRDLRNHVSHYEPIWKPHRLTGKELHWSHSVLSLKNTHSGILEMMKWCCPSTPLVYAASYGSRYFHRLCNTNAVKVFMNDPFAAIQFEPLPVIAPAVPAANAPEVC